MRLHTISDTVLRAIENRIARALNRLREDADLLFSDEADLLELLDEYLDGDDLVYLWLLKGRCILGGPSSSPMLSALAINVLLLPLLIIIFIFVWCQYYSLWW